MLRAEPGAVLQDGSSRFRFNSKRKGRGWWVTLHPPCRRLCQGRAADQWPCVKEGKSKRTDGQPATPATSADGPSAARGAARALGAGACMRLTRESPSWKSFPDLYSPFSLPSLSAAADTYTEAELQQSQERAQPASQGPGGAATYGGDARSQPTSSST